MGIIEELTVFEMIIMTLSLSRCVEVELLPELTLLLGVVIGAEVVELTVEVADKSTVAVPGTVDDEETWTIMGWMISHSPFS